MTQGILLRPRLRRTGIMKKLIIALLTFLPLAQAQTVPFIGSIEFPQTVRSIPTLCGYYKGTRFCIDTTQNEVSNTASFKIEESKNCTQLSLLFATKVVPFALKMAPNKYDNKILGLKVPSNSDYALYELNKMAICKEGKDCSYSWEITQKKLPTDRSLPEKTIIILLNPEFVESIRSIRWKPEDNIALLPVIAITETQGINDKLQKAAITLRLASMDLNAIHAPIKTQTKKDDLTLCIIRT